MGEYERLVALILSLPEDYRRVLELKFVEEESNREIARRLSRGRAWTLSQTSGAPPTPRESPSALSMR